MMKGLLAMGLAAILGFSVTSTANGQVQMGGDVNYVTYGSRVRFFIEELTNFGDATTERLRVRLWASEDNWNEFDRGRLIAFSLLPRLRPHEIRHDLSRRVHLYAPPNGWYYVTLTIEERVIDETGKHWELRDVVEFDGQHYFRRNYVGWPFPF